MPAAKKAVKKAAKPKSVADAMPENERPEPKARKRRPAPTYAFALLGEDGSPGAINGPYADQTAMLEDIAMSASSKVARVVTYREAKRGTLTMRAKIA